MISWVQSSRCLTPMVGSSHPPTYSSNPQPNHPTRSPDPTSPPAPTRKAYNNAPLANTSLLHPARTTQHNHNLIQSIIQHPGPVDASGSIDFPEFVQWWRLHAPDGPVTMTAHRPPPREPPPTNLPPQRTSPNSVNRQLGPPKSALKRQLSPMDVAKILEDKVRSIRWIASAHHPSFIMPPHTSSTLYYAPRRPALI